MQPVLSGKVANARRVLLLPALSSISTREEMRPLEAKLLSGYVTEAIDWPGFGIGPRPSTNWTPEILSDFLKDAIHRLEPSVVVAAGHSAAYVVRLLATNPSKVEFLVLVAPTWRGPLPTMMGSRKPWFTRIVSVLDNPIIGPVLYRLNVSQWVIRKMVREHVYSDTAWLSVARLRSKIAVTKGKGARHSSVRFVTGSLDRYAERREFLDDLARVRCPLLILYGDETPRRSRAEMDAMAELSNVSAKVMKRGKLAVHEEFAQEVALEITKFLDCNRPV